MAEQMDETANLLPQLIALRRQGPIFFAKAFFFLPRSGVQDTFKLTS